MTEGGDLLDRLRQVDPPGGSPFKTRWYRNPDGPEAATRLETLRDLLAEAIRDNREKTEAVRELRARVTELEGLLRTLLGMHDAEVFVREPWDTTFNEVRAALAAGEDTA